MLLDRWGRPVTNLRISVTNACNYECFFCHKEGHEIEGGEMTPSEITRLVRLLVRHGIRTVKITGGEPLIRRDLEEIVRGIREAGVEEISLVTNGWFLPERACSLKEAGLDRVNISLHSLRRDVYEKITGVDGLDRALKAVDTALECGLTPVKVNVTVLKGYNDNELWDLVKYASSKRIRIQFIELLDMDPGLRRYYYSLDRFEEELEKVALRKEIRELHGRPLYYLDGGAVVEIVKGTGNPFFCMRCNRIRVTSDGFFKTCIRREDNLVDFLSIMRNGGSDEELLEAFKRAVRLREPFHKPPKASPKYDDIVEL